jgi:hypothetical protein
MMPIKPPALMQNKIDCTRWFRQKSRFPLEQEPALGAPDILEGRT